MINKQPLVSVIIPTYQRADALPRAINSALNQDDYENIEVIVVDDNDGYNEYRKNTERLMEQYADNPRVMYIKHPHNMNGAAARNTGERASKGKYICLLDDDDIFLPTKIAKQVDYMENHPEFGASYTWRLDKRGNIIGYDKTGDLSSDILTLSFFPTTITLMIRRECYEGINGFDESFRRHQDFEFLLRFFEKYQIGVVQEPLSQIIGGAGDAGRLRGKQFENIKKQFLTTFDKKINEINIHDPGFKKKVYAAHYADVFTSHVHSKKYLSAIRVFIVSTVRYSPYYLQEVMKHYKASYNRRFGGNTTH